MIVDIYKQMIEDSPVAYLHIKIIEDEMGNYRALDVINYNKAYERIILIENELSINDIKKIIKNVDISNKVISFFNRLKNNKKVTVETYIEYAKRYFNIDAYYSGDNEFHFRLNEISSEKTKLSSALKNAPFSIWIKDRDGRYLDANQQYIDFLGTTLEDIVGKTNYDFTTKENADRICKIEDQVMKQNKLIKYQDGPAIRDGYYEVFKWPYMDKDKTMVLGVFSMAIDITEKLELTRELEEAKQQFLEIANSINDIIIVRDETKALYISPAFERIYKIKPDELYTDINKWYEYWDKIEYEVEECDGYNFDKPDTCTLKVSKKGQEDTWLWSRFTPIFDEEGNITKKIGVLSDISELKKMQLEVDNMKMDFLANLSHELRTPINLILSALQIIFLKIDKLDDETLDYFSKYLDIIAQNGRRLLKLVNNLIDTTRIDAGCFDYNPKNNDIVSCVEDICTSVVAFVNSNDLDIIFDTDVEEKIIAFDQDNMERIILNLVSNAIKFNKPNGKIEVNINCKEDIKIRIKDYGIGIPEEKLASIFGRFEQVKNKFKKEKEGSGIGLSLVKSLVEIHGGTIAVNSKLGEGSEFVITLPDILVKNEVETDIHTQYLSDENRMKVEFSDIYI